MNNSICKTWVALLVGCFSFSPAGQGAYSSFPMRVAFSPDGQQLLVGYLGGIAKIRDVAGTNAIIIPVGHQSGPLPGVTTESCWL